MADKYYKCPHCNAHNKVKSFTEKIEENIPSTVFGAVVSLFASAISLGAAAIAAGVAAAYAAYKWADGYTVTCHSCQKTFKVEP